MVEKVHGTDTWSGTVQTRTLLTYYSLNFLLMRFFMFFSSLILNLILILIHINVSPPFSLSLSLSLYIHIYNILLSTLFSLLLCLYIIVYQSKMFISFLLFLSFSDIFNKSQILLWGDVRNSHGTYSCVENGDR